MTESEMIALLAAAVQQPSAVRSEAITVEYRSASDLLALLTFLRRVKSAKITAISVECLGEVGRGA